MRLRPPQGLAPFRADPVLQDYTIGPSVNTTAGLNFDGIPHTGFIPPDTNGAVGAWQYVQFVNSSFEVFNKGTGTSLLGPLLGQTLWSDFTGDGGFCANTDNPGVDPVVAYDKAARGCPVRC